MIVKTDGSFATPLLSCILYTGPMVPGGLPASSGWVGCWNMANTHLTEQLVERGRVVLGGGGESGENQNWIFGRKENCSITLLSYWRVGHGQKWSQPVCPPLVNIIAFDQESIDWVTTQSTVYITMIMNMIFNLSNCWNEFPAPGVHSCWLRAVEWRGSRECQWCSQCWTQYKYWHNWLGTAHFSSSRINCSDIW